MKITHKIYNRTKSHAIYFLLVITMSGGLTSSAIAQSSGNLSLDVTPAPLVVNLKPASDTMLEIQLRNSGKAIEWLKVEPREFTTDKYGKLTVDYEKQPKIANWIQIQAPKFTLGPGQWFNQELVFNLPKEADYNYSFVLVISRVEREVMTPGKQKSTDSVLVPVLINVDKPGTTRKLELQRVSVSAGLYEYLPAKIDIRVKNSGNMTILTTGSASIDRGSRDKNPIVELALNEGKDYILPGNSRIFSVTWNDGFPRQETVISKDGTQKTSQVWDWSQIGKLRIGQYTAKVVAIYNDGLRDVRIERNVTFWVFPWKIVSGLVALLLAVSFVVWTLLKKTNKLHSQ